ncbi:cytochrome P460 family protein [Chryseolinea sp. H1M3-3]|uniref:cytochrome P460 family protein n=1 Tax=Chryseolinea sp. H1M3-3 TaxID=3034144 RepID=UPI0023EB6254|nr:cytochrome P460 family protein [Chryseolinea sp. H1M3-3]
MAFFILKACTNHDIHDPDYIDATDEDLFLEVKDAMPFYYQGGITIAPAAQSPHGEFKLRFNSIADGSLDKGELPSNGRFSDGSLIVKEVYLNSVLYIFAVMKKAPTDVNAKAGWLWAEYQLDGTPVVSIEVKGAGCINCHSETPNRDLVRTFDLH